MFFFRLATLRGMFPFVLLLVAAGCAGLQEYDASCIKETPLPVIERDPIPPAKDVPEEFARFSGIWAGGKWDGFRGTLCNTLVVFSVDKNGTAKLVYSWGDQPNWNTSPGWILVTATISGNRMVLERFRNNVQAEYYFQVVDGKPTLSGIYPHNFGVSYVTLWKQ